LTIGGLIADCQLPIANCQSTRPIANRYPNRQAAIANP
jgi:hypothetical protein